MASFLFQQFQGSCLRQSKTVEQWVALFGFLSSNASFLRRSIVVHFKQKRDFSLLEFQSPLFQYSCKDFLSIDLVSNLHL